jgi:hypothetical protein
MGYIKGDEDFAYHSRMNKIAMKKRKRYGKCP